MSEKTIIAVRNRIFGEKIKNEDKKTESGIYMPETVADTHARVKVISVGVDIENIVKPGDIVLTPPSFGYVIQLNGKNYIIFTIDEVMGIEKEIE